jgi:hypothetical protein
MSKRVLKKDPGLPLRIWDAYYPPSTLGTTLLWSAAGGGVRTGCRHSSSLQQKISKFLSRLAMAAALREGVTAIMAARGRASWTEYGQWLLSVAVDDESDGRVQWWRGRSMAATLADCEAAGAKRKT